MVATTSIIGDVVGAVAGDAVDLTVLMNAGQDPHSYSPSASDLTTVASADVIFVNGWDLEEGLIGDLETISEQTPLVPISAGIEPLPFGEGGHHHDEEEAAAGEEHAGEEAHDHGAVDPHTWFSVANVRQWVENARTSLSRLDPANAATYEQNAAAYLAQLDELDAYVRETAGAIPPERRVLVTNHDNLGYFARDYGFEVLGAVIPSSSSLAEPSASDLTDLIGAMRAEGVCSLFSETTVSDRLAQTVGAELGDCSEVRVLQLYTDALGPAGSGADSYIGLMRTNVETIATGLQ